MCLDASTGHKGAENTSCQWAHGWRRDQPLGRSLFVIFDLSPTARKIHTITRHRNPKYGKITDLKVSYVTS
jgi:hypothetical protein